MVFIEIEIERVCLSFFCISMFVLINVTNFCKTQLQFNFVYAHISRHLQTLVLFNIFIRNYESYMGNFSLMSACQ